MRLVFSSGYRPIHRITRLDVKGGQVAATVLQVTESGIFPNAFLQQQWEVVKE